MDTPFKIHFIHVGNMANKGTQALLKSDICVLREIITGDIAFSVSTTDIDGVRRLGLPSNSVFPPMIDIPYETADAFAKRLGFSRTSTDYKVFALGGLIFMFAQALLSAVSATMAKLGMKGFYRSKLLEHVKDSDLVVSYSDENFKEAASFLPLNIYWVLTWWSMLLSRTWDVLIAKFLGRRVVVFPNSVGPFRTRVGRLLGRFVLNRCDYILVREPTSYEIVNLLGVQPPRELTSDTSLLLTGEGATDIGSLCHPLIGVSPGFYAYSLPHKDVEEYIAGHAKALDAAIDRHGFSVVFLPHYISGFQYDDLEVSKLIFSQMRNKERAKIIEIRSVEEFKSALGSMDLVISSKMHPAVLAMSGYAPTLCIAYDQKQSGFFKRLDLDDCVLLIHEFSHEKLLSMVEHVWNKREEVRMLLREKIPLLRNEVRKAIRHAVSPSLRSV